MRSYRRQWGGETRLIGSDARHGIAAFVPRRSLTLTTIMGSADWAAAMAFFSLFSFFLCRRSSFSCCSVFSRPASPSLCLSPDRGASRSRSLRGDRGRSSLSLYPRSNLRSSPLAAESSSRRFSFQRNPPPVFRGRSWPWPGDLLRLRSSTIVADI